MSLVTEIQEKKIAPSTDEKYILKNAVSYLKFAIPAVFSELGSSLVFETSSLARNKWIISMQLVITATYYRLNCVQTKPMQASIIHGLSMA